MAVAWLTAILQLGLGFEPVFDTEFFGGAATLNKLVFFSKNPSSNSQIKCKKVNYHSF